MSGSSKRVFLTGARGFVASHILAKLLERGYLVTASVRSESQAREILALNPSWKGALNFVYISDITAEGIFDDVFLKADYAFDYIIHTASPTSFDITDFQRDLINPAVQGTVGLLKSAHQFGGSSLKRFVYLSSAVTILNSLQDIGRAGENYTEKDWNPITAARAIESKNPVLGYSASKKLAEEAAWRFVEDKKPVFDLTSINPIVITGPMLQPISGPKSVTGTNKSFVYSFMDGEYKQIDSVKFPFYHHVDVRDVALAHIIALTSPQASGQRILLADELITPQLVANIIRRNFPELRDRVPEGDPNRILPDGVNPTGWDPTKSTQILGGEDWKYTPLEVSIVDTVKDLLAREKEWQV
ncbi:hypothetical protein GJ744_006812 [Endocarpon pusillum]|uniref:NAD-dependent epimerase/dehydratase domain-containing protein n=1 Tax=Endocarpon pusillum TaxID=364733 RepID=A0A8H7ANH0_9EURO|nr:hypothetical protein GJ744_006812 [Endocarpon pusillum]